MRRCEPLISDSANYVARRKRPFALIEPIFISWDTDSDFACTSLPLSDAERSLDSFGLRSDSYLETVEIEQSLYRHVWNRASKCACRSWSPSVDLLVANKYLEVVRKAYDIDLWHEKNQRITGNMIQERIDNDHG